MSFLNDSDDSGVPNTAELASFDVQDEDLFQGARNGAKQLAPGVNIGARSQP